MAWRAFPFVQSHKKLGTLSIFSAALDLVLTFIFLVTACISILTSKVMRIYQTEHLCCERRLNSAEIHVISAIKKVLCKHHTKTLIAVNTIGTDQLQSVNVHDLCEGCTRNSSCSDRSPNYKDSVTFAKVGELFPKQKFASKKGFQTCKYKIIKSRDCRVPKYVRFKEADIGSEEEVKRHSGNDDSSSLTGSDGQDFSRMCCFAREGPWQGIDRRDNSTERMSTQYSLGSYEDYFCSSSDIADTNSENCLLTVRSNKELLERGPSHHQDEGSKKLRKIDRVTEGFPLNMRGAFDQCFFRQGDRKLGTAVPGDELSHNVNECNPTHSSRNTTFKHDKGFKAKEPIKEDGDIHATVHEDVKKEVLQRGCEPGSTKNDLKESIKAGGKAVDCLSEGSKDKECALALAALEINNKTSLNENTVMTLSLGTPFKQLEAERCIMNNGESCKSRLLHSKLRHWRQNQIKSEELENYYGTRRMSLAKRSEKLALFLEARKENFLSIQSATKQPIQLNSLAGAETTKASKLNIPRIPLKLHGEKIWRKLLIIPEMSNDIFVSKMTNEEEKCGETRDTESWSSMFHICQQHNGTNLVKACETHEYIPSDINMIDKEESCSEKAYSDGASSVLGFYFETKGGESWGTCQGH